MAGYKLTKDGVQDLETMAFIPNSPTNRDWRKYLQWVAEGNVPAAEFSAAELAAQKQRRSKQIKTSIVDMRLRIDAAKVEGLTEIEDESQIELNKLRDELAEIQTGPQKL